jgi:DNA-binding MarR family transcriptional regulator
MTAGSPVMQTRPIGADVQSALIDAALWTYHGFFVPGDHLLSLLSTHAPRVAEFLALDAVARGSMVSGLISAVVWLGAILLIVVVYRLIRDVDRALTALVVRLHDELQRTVRVVVRRLTIAVRSYALERRARLARTEVAEQPALSGLQLEVLQAHAALPPGYLLTPRELASDLDMRTADIEQALLMLRKLSFVERTFGAGDGEDGYRLTRAGAALLAACSGAQPVMHDPLPQHTLRPRRIEPTVGRI